MKPYELYDLRTGNLAWSGFLSNQPEVGCLITLQPQPDESQPDQKPRYYLIQQTRLTLQEGIATEVAAMKLIGVEIDPQTGKPVEPIVKAVSLAKVH